ncbi:hypothetical protein [Nannocystis pusilla]|uniref:hypothetical protein n=1 Tax=Nannocystis pusilla TaxID=889268 RepID=UPI003B77A0A0
MSTPRHLLRRSAVFALFVALASSPLACKKGADTAGPDAAGGSAEQAGGTELRYKASAYKLRADVKFSFKATSPQGVNEASGDLSGLLDVTDAGGGKIKVGLSVAEVREFVLGKDMLPPPRRARPRSTPRPRSRASPAPSSPTCAASSTRPAPRRCRRRRQPRRRRASRPRWPASPPACSACPSCRRPRWSRARRSRRPSARTRTCRAW